MPERIKLFCEGPHDRVLLETLRGLGVLPQSLDIEKPASAATQGKDAIPAKVAANLAAGLSAIAVRDYDELRGDQVARWLANKLRLDERAVSPLAGTSDAFVVRAAHPVVVIGVGHLGQTPPEVATVTRGTVDEYLFGMLLDRDVYEAASEINQCPHDVWRKKLIETRQMIEQNGLPAPTLKQLVRLPHLLTSFEGAPTTLTAKAVDAAHHVGKLDALTDPLRTTVVRAVEHCLAG